MKGIERSIISGLTRRGGHTLTSTWRRSRDTRWSIPPWPKPSGPAGKDDRMTGLMPPPPPAGRSPFPAPRPPRWRCWLRAAEHGHVVSWARTGSRRCALDPESPRLHPVSFSRQLQRGDRSRTSIRTSFLRARPWGSASTTGASASPLLPGAIRVCFDLSGFDLVVSF